MIGNRKNMARFVLTASRVEHLHDAGGQPCRYCLLSSRSIFKTRRLSHIAGEHLSMCSNQLQSAPLFVWTLLDQGSLRLNRGGIVGRSAMLAERNRPLGLCHRPNQSANTTGEAGWKMSIPHNVTTVCLNYRWLTWKPGTDRSLRFSPGDGVKT